MWNTVILLKFYYQMNIVYISLKKYFENYVLKTNHPPARRAPRGGICFLMKFKVYPKFFKNQRTDPIEIFFTPYRWPD